MLDDDNDDAGKIRFRTLCVPGVRWPKLPKTKRLRLSNTYAYSFVPFYFPVFSFIVLHFVRFPLCAKSPYKYRRHFLVQNDRSK